MRRTPSSLGVKPKRRNKKSHRSNDSLKQNNELKSMRFAILQDPDTTEWIGYEVAAEGKWMESCRYIYRWDVQEKFGI